MGLLGKALIYPIRFPKSLCLSPLPPFFSLFNTKKRLQKRDGCSWKMLRGVGLGQGTRQGSEQGPDLSLGGWGQLTAFSRLAKGVCRSLGTTGLDRIKLSLPFPEIATFLIRNNPFGR